MQKSNAVTILILGILGFCCFPCGIIAWIMGNKTLQAMDAGQMENHDRNLANIGKILGIVFTILNVIGLIINISMGGALMSGFGG